MVSGVNISRFVFLRFLLDFALTDHQYVGILRGAWGDETPEDPPATFLDVVPSGKEVKVEEGRDER